MHLALRFISWNPDTEEARVALVFGPDAKPDGSGGYVALLVVRDEQHARDIVTQANATHPEPP